MEFVFKDPAARVDFFEELARKVDFLAKHSEWRVYMVGTLKTPVEVSAYLQITSASFSKLKTGEHFFGFFYKSLDFNCLTFMVESFQRALVEKYNGEETLTLVYKEGRRKTVELCLRFCKMEDMAGEIFNDLTKDL